LACGIDEGEIARAADGRCVVRVAGQKPLLERDRDFLCESDADEPPVATVSPSRISRTASAAETTLPRSASWNPLSKGWVEVVIGACSR
jgi:hypothetical protein